MLVAEVLGELGYTALDNLPDGASALQVLRSDTRIDLLVTDVGLPGGMNGQATSDFGRTARPDLKVLLVTGYARETAMGTEGLGQGWQFLQSLLRWRAWQLASRTSCSVEK